MAKRGGLGRGLEAIFEDAPSKASAAKEGAKTESGSDTVKNEAKTSKRADKEKGRGPALKAGKGVLPVIKEDADKTSEDIGHDRRFVRISLIEPNRGQPRKSFDEESLSELAESIKRFGLLQPLIVRKTGFTYTIIAGERRWRAARLAGLKEVPVIIRDFADEDAAEIALIENIQREDLKPLEEALAYKELMESYGLTQEAVAEKVAKSRAAIANSLRLLQLPKEVQELISEGRLSAGHARCLITIEDRESLIKLAREIADKQLSVREAEKRAAALKKKLKDSAEAKAEGEEALDEAKRADNERIQILMEALERELTEGLETKVRIKSGGKEKGRIEIEYYSLDELDRLVKRLR